MKIKIGNTRIDIMGGFQQYIVAAAKILSGKIVSTTSGKVMTLGEGYRALNREEIIINLLSNKESPVASFITDLLKGKDAAGKPISIPIAVGQRFIPMVAGDLYDIAKDNPKLIPLIIPGIFGTGLQTYPPAPIKSSVKLPGLPGLDGGPTIRTPVGAGIKLPGLPGL